MTIFTMMSMRVCGLDSLMDYFNVHDRDVWEEICQERRREIQIEHIYSLGFQDIREVHKI
jgi:hypothetical protein